MWITILILGTLFTIIGIGVVKGLKKPKITVSKPIDDGSIKEPNPPIDENLPEPL